MQHLHARSMEGCPIHVGRKIRVGIDRRRKIAAYVKASRVTAAERSTKLNARDIIDDAAAGRGPVEKGLNRCVGVRAQTAE